jgi:hypothetical protein
MKPICLNYYLRKSLSYEINKLISKKLGEKLGIFLINRLEAKIHTELAFVLNYRMAVMLDNTTKKELNIINLQKRKI